MPVENRRFGREWGSRRWADLILDQCAQVAVVDRLQAELQVSPDRIIYVGDGSSDVHVMLHVNHHDGFTIAVSENKHIAPITKRTVLSDNSLGVLVPILEEMVGWQRWQIRALFESCGFLIQEWDKVQTDWLTIRETTPAVNLASTSAPTAN